jgi:hypothetical protein
LGFQCLYQKSQTANNVQIKQNASLKLNFRVIIKIDIKGNRLLFFNNLYTNTSNWVFYPIMDKLY